MAKHTKLYDNSPKLGRSEEGEIEVKRAEKKTESKDGSSAEDDGEVKNTDPSEAERSAMHKRHEEELTSMHERHKKDLKEIHKRHAPKTETGGELINKVEKDEKESD